MRRWVFATTVLAVLGVGVSADTVYLSDLDLSRMSAGWGKALKDQAVTSRPMSICGRPFARGVGTHSRSVALYSLDGSAGRFQAMVGVDDAAGNKGASVRFMVGIDGRKVFDSGVMHLGEAAKPVDLPLSGHTTLTLVATDGGDGINYDHADWADARFEGLATNPRAISAPLEKSVVLTPLAPATPRINGPRIFGCRTGRPFLFTIPATGRRPLAFAAAGLPAGLNLDAATGRISGRVRSAGSYRVRLTVRNRLGTARRDLKIVSGGRLALTPPMGWNSWYVHEGRVTDRIMRQAADAMVSTGLADHGFSYVNIDDCWMVRPGDPNPELGGEPRNADGSLRGNGRFPDMPALADYIHARGLKAGLYISPGPTTCAGFTGSYQHEAQDARTFAEWGFDFLKYDWCSYGNVAGGDDRAHLIKPYQVMWDALQEQDRDIVFNLCQYGMGNVWEWGRKVGHCWRTAGDLGAGFDAIPSAVDSIGFGQADLARWAGPGGWNDPDYLLLGYLSNWRGGTAPTPLTPSEQYTHVSLWCLLASPLFLSGDITRLDPFTLGLLTNDEVLEVDQDPLGRQARRMKRDGECEVWAKPMEDGSVAIGLFNRSEFEGRLKVAWRELGLKRVVRVRDLWPQADLKGVLGGITVTLPRHGCRLLRVWPVR